MDKLSSKVQRTCWGCFAPAGVHTSGLLYFLGAELCCGGGSGVVGGAVVPEQEVAPSEDCADALLSGFTHLDRTRGRF